MVAGDIAGSSRRCAECKRRRKKVSLEAVRKPDCSYDAERKASVIYKSPNVPAAVKVALDAADQANRPSSSTPEPTLFYGSLQG
jgi:hypothetical protein